MVNLSKFNLPDMKKFKINIDSEDPEVLKEEVKELAFILTGLRETTKFWQDHFGAENRNRMRRWEEKADAWIEQHKIVYEQKIKTENNGRRFPTEVHEAG
jgi:hypothetical protein